VRPAAVLLVAAASVALAVAAVKAFGDRETLVPPPEAVAEQFVRGVLAGRSEQAMQHVSRSPRGGLSDEALDRWGRRVEDEIGKIGTVQAHAGRLSDDQASAVILLAGSRALRSLEFELARENGQWKIARIPL
jgi:hypothetical protein